MSEVKSPEVLLQEEQAKTEQLTTDLQTERDARGKAEQEARDANTRAADLDRQLKAERTAHGATKNELADANALVDQLSTDQPDARQVPTATLGSGATAKTYRVVVPRFNVAGFGVVAAEDVKSNSALLKALVETGSGVLELVTAGK